MCWLMARSTCAASRQMWADGPFDVRNRACSCALAVAVCARLTAASSASAMAAGSYATESRDLEENDDDDDELSPAERRRAQAQAVANAVKRRTRAETDEEEAAQQLLRLSLEAAVGAQPFAPRGSVTLNFAPARGAKAIAFSPAQGGNKKQLKAALDAQANALYRLRFVQEGQKAKDAIMAAVPVVSGRRRSGDGGNRIEMPRRIAMLSRIATRQRDAIPRFIESHPHRLTVSAACALCLSFSALLLRLISMRTLFSTWIPTARCCLCRIARR